MKKVFYFCMIAAVAVIFSFFTGCAAPGSGAGSQPENLPAILINEAQVESKKNCYRKRCNKTIVGFT